jgi:hypothetical protein
MGKVHAGAGSPVRRERTVEPNGHMTRREPLHRLRQKRRDLLAQLEAVDKELAIVESSEASTEKCRDLAATVLPTRLKPAKTLSDDHKHALMEGRRKAFHANEVARGLARAPLEHVAGLGNRATNDGPRLVRRRLR